MLKIKNKYNSTIALFRMFFNVLLFLFWIPQISYSQDIIITNNGDALNAKIKAIDNDYIYFYYLHNTIESDTAIAFENVRDYERNFYEKYSGDTQHKYPKIRLGVQSGGTILFGNTPLFNSSYFRNKGDKAKWGTSVGADCSYFLSDIVGIGIKSSLTKTSGQIDNIYSIDSINGIIKQDNLNLTTRNDDISILYVGLLFSTKFKSSNPKVQLYNDFSLGYITYTNRANLQHSFSLSSKTFGLYNGFGFDYVLGGGISLGLNLSYTLSMLNYYHYKDANQQFIIQFKEFGYDDISRLDLSIVLRWHR